MGRGQCENLIVSNIFFPMTLMDKKNWLVPYTIGPEGKYGEN
jgi:hypothetical protein